MRIVPGVIAMNPGFFSRVSPTPWLRCLVAVIGVAVLLQFGGCADGSIAALDAIGAKIFPSDIDFAPIYEEARRSEASYAGPKLIRSSYPLTIRIKAPDGSKVLYFLERDDKQHSQHITVRGTDNWANLSQDMDVTVRDDRLIKIPVHTGFDRDARAVYQDSKPYMRAGYKTYVSGHSLGGAVAALLAIYLIEDGFDVERVTTFGQPRFTTAEGVKQLGFLPLTRVVDENDIVPVVPPGFEAAKEYGPYEHVGKEVILLNGEDFVFLPSEDATRISLGDFWRTLRYDDLKDHEIKKYLLLISDKLTASKQVPYDEREKFIVSDVSQVVK